MDGIGDRHAEPDMPNGQRLVRGPSGLVAYHPDGTPEWVPPPADLLEKAQAKFRDAGITGWDVLAVLNHAVTSIRSRKLRGEEVHPGREWLLLAVREWAMLEAHRLATERAWLPTVGDPPPPDPALAAPPACAFHEGRAAVKRLNGTPICEECVLRMVAAVRDAAAVVVTTAPTAPAGTTLDAEQVRAAARYLFARMTLELLPPPPTPPPAPRPTPNAAPEPRDLWLLRLLGGPVPTPAPAPPALRCDDVVYRQVVDAYLTLRREPGPLRGREITAAHVLAVLKGQRPDAPLDDPKKLRDRFRGISRRAKQKLRYSDAVRDAKAVYAAEVAGQRDE